MTILITGGLGFIGSHTIVELIKNKFNDILIIDNLSNSKIDVLDKIKMITTIENINFIKLDILNKKELEKVFTENKIDTIIHFAAVKSVNESIKLPDKYYKINIEGTLNLLEMMKKFNCKNFIFSSSATVYGEQSYPVDENSKTGINITNPYGKTKYFVEEIIKDYSKAYPNLNFIILRYFNPVGAHESGLIGEDPNDIPNNLLPFILKVAVNKLDKLTIFGNDYNTYDGTCIRDFIHVVDLAEAHLFAYNALIDNKISGLRIYNVGTGKGISVGEFIKTFEEVNMIKINWEFGQRREGDLEIVFSKVDKIYNELGWKCKKTLTDICKDSYKFINLNSLKN